MEVTKLTKKRIMEYLSIGKRFDKRKLLEFRNIEIELGISNKAEGSARVRLGKTEVLAGVKLDVSEPYTDSPDSGVLAVVVELLPLASEKFELGPPKIEAIELARIVDRGIRESGMIDLKKLCIRKEELVWNISLDIYPINDDGNLFDASCIAAVAALLDAKIPKLEKDKVVYGELTEKTLPLTKSIPLTLTFFKIGKNFVLDPCSEEEEASDARLTLALSPSDKEIFINAVQKGGEEALEQEKIFELIDTAIKKWSELYPEVLDKIKKAKEAREKKKETK